MKKYILICTVLAVIVSSCAKKLDLLPQQSVAEEVALSSDANVKKVLNGAYDALSDDDLFGGNVFLFAELQAANDEIRWEGTYNEPREIWLKSILTTNSFVRDTWLEAYKAINISNNILSAINVVNVTDQNRVKGEALFIRAALYFELIKFYAKPYSAGSVASNLGVPIVLVPTRGIDPGSKVPRSTVEQVYTQILADLNEAESLLPNTNGNYATKAAAAAILSRVYLQMERFPDARDAANRAITVATANGKSLASTYAAAFNNSSNSPEYLFAIQLNAQDGDNTMHTYWSIPAYGGRDGDVSIEATHLAQYSIGDARLALFYSGAGATRSGKWQQQYKVLPVIRLAELYLTRAEANLRAGTSIGASPMTDINKTRQRAGLLPFVIAPTLPEILFERKLELAHEGHTIHEFKRLRLPTDGFPYNDNKLVFPIPQREIDASGGILIQNPGYF